MTKPLTYTDDDQCEICEFDWVTFKSDEPGSLPGEGAVVQIFPRKQAVRIRYENPNWRHKPTYKSETVPVRNITLIQRDG